MYKKTFFHNSGMYTSTFLVLRRILLSKMEVSSLATEIRGCSCFCELMSGKQTETDMTNYNTDSGSTPFKLKVSISHSYVELNY